MRLSSILRGNGSVYEDASEGAAESVDRRAVAGFFLLFLTLAVALWSIPNGRFVLVLTNPSHGAGESLAVVERAGGYFVSSGRMPWMTVAYSDADDFASRLMGAGAILVLNHQLAVGCLQRNLK